MVGCKFLFIDGTVGKLKNINLSAFSKIFYDNKYLLRRPPPAFHPPERSGAQRNGAREDGMQVVGAFTKANERGSGIRLDSHFLVSKTETRKIFENQSVRSSHVTHISQGWNRSREVRSCLPCWSRKVSHSSTTHQASRSAPHRPPARRTAHTTAAAQHLTRPGLPAWHGKTRL